MAGKFNCSSVQEGKQTSVTSNKPWVSHTFQAQMARALCAVLHGHEWLVRKRNVVYVY